MLRRLAPWLLLLPLGFAQAAAGDEPAKEAPPLSAGQAAERVLEALERHDPDALTALARKDRPDPWLVADELCSREEHEAAVAWASAARRKTTETLPAYVEAQKDREPNAEAREAVARLERLWKRKPKAALHAVEGLSLPSDTVLAIRLAYGRGYAYCRLWKNKKAAAEFGRAAEAAARMGWLLRLSSAEFQCGLNRNWAKDFDGAIECFGRALEIDDDLGDLRRVRSLCRNIAHCHASSDRHETALAWIRRWLDLATELGDRSSIALAHAQTALSLQSLGRYDEALSSNQTALEHYRARNDRAGMAQVLINSGGIHKSVQELTRAQSFFERGLVEALASGHEHWTGRALWNLARLHRKLGDYRKSISYYERMLPVWEKLKYVERRARAYEEYGSTLRRMGEYARALDVLETGLDLSRRKGLPAIRADIVNLMGGVYAEVRSHDRALECYRKAGEAYEAMGDHEGATASFINAGTVHRDRGDFDGALRCFVEGLERAREHDRQDWVAITLENLGILRDRQGELEAALGLFRQALDLFEARADPLGTSRSLSQIGDLLRRREHFEEAEEAARRACSVAEGAGSPRETVLALRTLADVHLARGDESAALECARRGVAAFGGTARGLSEENEASLREDWFRIFDVGAAAALALDRPDDVLFFLETGRAGALLGSLRARDTLSEDLTPPDLRKEEVAARHRETRAAARLREILSTGRLKEIRACRTELAAVRAMTLEVIARIQRKAKATSDLIHPRPDAPAVIRGRLKEEEAMVLYGLLREGAVAWVATRDASRLVRLGDRAEVYDAAACDLSDPRADTAAGIARLRRLLVEPLELGPKTRRVLISPDASLGYVPFALLVGNREVVYVPSATTIGVLADLDGGGGDGVLALGDPDYSAFLAPSALVAMRSGGRLAPLPASREEAERVGDVVLLGKEASEERLRHAIAKRPRWRAVHLACHGRVDPERALLSSLALTPTTESDGFLSCTEIFRMKIPSELVVLSACETATGRIYRAEGIVGLTRAFMYAGAPRVLCSLWKVDDEATKALMVKFYELWNAKDGRRVSTAAALKQAQEFVRGHEEWEHPYYWAAWVLWGLP